MRLKDSTVPVLIVTARDELSQRIEGLDTGADDYVQKPFEMTELLARMRGSRPAQGAVVATPVLGNGAMTLDPATREAKVEGQAVRLSAARVFSAPRIADPSRRHFVAR